MKNITLFNNYKHKYITLASILFNHSYQNKSLTKKEALKLIDEYGFNENYDFMEIFSAPTLQQLINIDNTSATTNLNCKIPFIPTTYEIDWLLYILSLDECELFLSNDTINKLKILFKENQNVISKDYFINKNTFNKEENMNPSMYSIFFKNILTAIRQQKYITYTYVTRRNNIITEPKGIPISLEYSPLNEKFRLYVYSETTKQITNINLNQLQKLDVMDDNITSNLPKTCEPANALKANEPIILKVENIPYISNRFFTLFSNYEKKSYYHEEENHFIVKLFYYTVNEAEIIKDILSFGSHVIIVSPNSIRNKIIDRIQKINMLYDNKSY